MAQEDTVLVDLLRKQEKPNMLLRSVLGRIKRSVWGILREQTEFCPVVDSTASMEINNVENFPYIRRFLDKIKIAKEKSDIVVLCMHSGGQFNFYQGVGVYTKYVVELAKQAGVDCIIGNHTHCIMPLIWEDDCVIAYSLGNFCFTPGDGYYVRNVYADYSMLLNVDISVESKTIQKVSFSILKTIRNADDSTEVWDTYDLFHKLSDKKEKLSLYEDCKAICDQMISLKDPVFKICKEYIVRLA